MEAALQHVYLVMHPINEAMFLIDLFVRGSLANRASALRVSLRDIPHLIDQK